jgi:hypothetical protein
MIVDVFFQILAISSSPLQHWKDLSMSVSLYVFYNRILQRRLHLVDNMPIDDFATFMLILYASMLVMRIMTSRTLKLGDPCDCTCDSTCTCTCTITKLVNTIPFVHECYISCKKILQIIQIFKLKSSINMKVEETPVEDEAEDMKLWEEILDKSHMINQIEIDQENQEIVKKRLSVISIVGDISQVMGLHLK